MASFNPHVGMAIAGYTALPSVTVSGVLDSIVTDLGAGVNGWSLHDDLRTGGSSYPIVGPVYTSSGQLRQYYANTLSWNFTNGSTVATGYAPYGYHYAYAVSGFSGSRTQISLDQVNWYGVSYTATVSNYSTGTLDQPFAQATQSVRTIYRKLTRYIVLKQTSATKTFYVLIAQAPECTGGPVLFFQVFETWDALSHTGTGASAMEHVRFYYEGTAPLDISCRYILWLLPEVFAIWTTGDGGQAYTPDARFVYIGNLDVSGMRSTDPDALVFISGDTTASGYFIMGNPTLFAAPSPIQWVGAAQCLRTLNGEQWSMPQYNGVGTYPRNQYQIFPRGRWYAYNLPYLQVLDQAGRFEVCDLDVWHTPLFSNYQSWGGGTEGRRGKLRYVKIPVGNPSGMNLGTFGPANDGVVYIVLRQGNAFRTTAAQLVAVQQVLETMGTVNDMATAWGYSTPPGQSANQFTSDIYNAYNTYQNAQFTYLLMPISI